MKLIFCILASVLILYSCEPKRKVVDETPSPPANFVEVTSGRIATDGGGSRGVAWGDFNNDGDPDLYVANNNGQWNAFYRNDGKGKFKKLTDDSELLAPFSETVKYGGRSEGVNWVDYDNDGDLDLYVSNRGEDPCFLFRNESGKGFTRILDSPLTVPGVVVSMACWADFDMDGDLDVFLAVANQPNLAFENIGQGEFKAIDISSLTVNDEGRARACGCADADGDGLPEIYIANAMKGNFYFKNEGNLNFKSIDSGHHVEDVGYSYGVSWADFDEDGDLDLFVANFNKENYIYKNDGNGNLSLHLDNIISGVQGGASKGHTWGDYNNDGNLDLYVANGTYREDMRNYLFYGNGEGRYRKIEEEDILKHADTSAGAAHADFDRDGDLDIFVASWGSGDQINRFYENTTNGKNWVSFRLKGETVNSYGIGTKLELTVSDGTKTKKLYRWMYPITGYGSQNDYELHFGLGGFKNIDRLVVTWPDNSIEKYPELNLKKHYLIIQGEPRLHLIE